MWRIVKNSSRIADAVGRVFKTSGGVLASCLFCSLTARTQPGSPNPSNTSNPPAKGIFKQSDLIGIFHTAFHIPARKPVRVEGKTIYFSFVPGGDQTGSPGTAFLTSTTAAFYAGDRNSSFLSNITFSPYLTFKGRFGYTLRSNIWTNRNEWDILGDIRFLYYPQYTWGLGGNPAHSNSLLVSYKYVRFYQTFLKRIRPYLFAGFGYHFDDHFDMDTMGDSTLLQRFTGYHYGTGSSENSLSSGISVNLLYDSRRNPVNPIPGFYGNLVYRFNPTFLGSNSYWHSLYADIRRYIPFSHTRQNMLAFWTFYWTTLSNHAPYLDLPSLGWDPYQQRSGRGFEQNRYRGNRLFYLEGEYRRDLTANGLLGFVLFSNLNAVSEPVSHRFEYLHPAGGGGLRIRFNRQSGTNLALDYGFSRNYSAFYLNLGETF
ncbi:MAG: hypothetical protein P4L51_26955 [Puia sp.]|nr:hypothetical protein [Puia sp.]